MVVTSHLCANKFVEKLLVVVRRVFELSHENVGVPQIAVGSSFGGFVPELASYGQAFFMVMDSFSKIAQQVVGVSQIAASSSLCSYVLQLSH